VILLTVEQFGRLNHALRREVARIFGDGTVPPDWDDAPEWMHAESARSARKLLENPGMMAEEEHDRWMRQKIADGWTQGPVRDDEAKIHPSLLPFDQLPPGERLKDLLRVSLAGSLAGYVALDREATDFEVAAIADGRRCDLERDLALLAGLLPCGRCGNHGHQAKDCTRQLAGPPAGKAPERAARPVADLPVLR